jgi:leucyl-tRNA synthetase
MTSERYNARDSEPRWQRQWDEKAIFASKNDDPRPKYYVLEMFPYPSGRIHIGHVRNYTLGDVLARFMRAKGFNVLHPMGWDAFGLPAENAAIERKVAPKAWTYENIAAMKKQLRSIGLSLDWSREFATCDPSYYKHQQKMFLDFLREGLAEREKRKINWDPVDMTVLANEQVIDGRGWRSGAVVEQREMNQWVFKITKYSQELLDALDGLDRWPDDDAGRRIRAEDLYDAARHAVRRKVHGDFGRSSAGAGRGCEESEAGRVHRRREEDRHRAGNHRHRREAGF